MIKPTFYACALLAISTAAFAPAPALAQVDVSLVIGNAPPPPRFESVPQPRRGYVWVPGYWNWNGHRHIWASGHWEPERVGYQYRPSTWVREADGWRMEPGTWISLNGGNVGTGYAYASVPPPPPRYEVVPAPRSGFVWSPGYWEWRGSRHEWVPGHWMAERPGYVYMAPRWIERDGRWIREEGRWDRYERHARYRDRDRDGIPDRYEHGRRDRDHDGVPDRYDRDRDNDGVPNRYDRDRDGDGVPNRYDERPDNPRRH